MAEKWVSVADACQLLEVSERTLYRKIKDEKIQSRMTDDGRREVLVTVPMTQEELAEGHLKLASETVDSQMKIVATALGSTEMVSKRMQAELDFVKTELERVRDHSREEMDRFQEQSRNQIEFVKSEIVRTRKMGMIGWGAAIGIAVVLGILTLITVKALSERKGELAVAIQETEAEKQRSVLLTDVLSDKKKQVTRLEEELGRVRADMTNILSDKKKEAVRQPVSRPAEESGYRHTADITGLLSDTLDTTGLKDSAVTNVTKPAASQPVATQPTTQVAIPSTQSLRPLIRTGI